MTGKFLEKCKIKFSAEQLQALAARYKAGETTEDLSEAYGICKCSIGRRLRAMGVPMRASGKAVKATTAIMTAATRLRAQGKTWPEIEERTGVSQHTIRRRLLRERSMRGSIET